MAEDIDLICVSEKQKYFLKLGLTRGSKNRAGDLPVGQQQPVRQFVGWVEPFTKPIAIARNIWVSLGLHPSCALMLPRPAHPAPS
jgi:hypothetical protein